MKKTPNIFVFTAEGGEAKVHLARSITSSISDSLMFENFRTDDHDELRRIRDSAGGFYAWGAQLGSQNISRWRAMNAGDIVLGVFDFSYKIVATIQGKFDSHRAAAALWNTNARTGSTFQLMYFLSRPEPIDIAVRSLSPPLAGGYQGFTKISAERVHCLLNEFDTSHDFVEHLKRISRS